MKQKKKKGLSILVLAAGLLLQFTGICIGPVHFRMISGICIGIGAVFFSLSVHQLYRLSCEKSFPDLVHLEQIEKRDERNIQIRRQAKSVTSDISRWALIGLAWINFLINGPLWMTLALMGIFLLIYILEWHYVNKYQKEM